MLKALIFSVTSFKIAALLSGAVGPQRRLLGLVDLWWLAICAAVRRLHNWSPLRASTSQSTGNLSLCGLDVAYDGCSCRRLLSSIDRNERVGANDRSTHRHSVQT
jgi:hypothetical protein